MKSERLASVDRKEEARPCALSGGLPEVLDSAGGLETRRCVNEVRRKKAKEQESQSYDCHTGGCPFRFSSTRIRPVASADHENEAKHHKAEEGRANDVFGSHLATPASGLVPLVVQIKHDAACDEAVDPK
jgi:hypothetical protein